MLEGRDRMRSAGIAAVYGVLAGVLGSLFASAYLICEDIRGARRA